MALYFEDLEVGTVQRFGRYEVTREEIIEFASKYDPQYFHLDEEAAADGLFGRLAASGWHTGAMALRMVVDHWKVTGMAETSLGGAGMDEVRWLSPVYPGDVLQCEIELFEKIPSRSKPFMGIIKSQWNVYNQDDVLVMSMILTGIVRTRPAENA